MSIVFCGFSSFVNTNFLHNRRDNKLNHAKFYQILSQCSTKFNQNLMGWSLVHPFNGTTLPQTFQPFRKHNLHVIT